MMPVRVKRSTTSKALVGVFNILDLTGSSWVWNKMNLLESRAHPLAIFWNSGIWTNITSKTALTHWKKRKKHMVSCVCLFWGYGCTFNQDIFTHFSNCAWRHARHHIMLTGKSLNLLPYHCEIKATGAKNRSCDHKLLNIFQYMMTVERLITTRITPIVRNIPNCCWEFTKWGMHSPFEF